MSKTGQKLLSMCIPTYNRAGCLKRLLDDIIPQILSTGEAVEICISSNGSTDNTREIVLDLAKKHPGLIRYSENEKDLGFDRNVLKVVSMAEGEFVWTFSDDDVIVEKGIKEVIGFIKENKDKDMGGMVVKFSSYTQDSRTGEQIRYQTSVDKNKPEKYGGLSCVQMLRDGNAYNGLSEIIFNNGFLQKNLKERDNLVKKGIGSHHLHTWLYFLLFLLNREAKFYVLNKNIAESPDTVSKASYMVDDHLELLYRGRIRFYDDLIAIVDKSDKDVIKALKKLKGSPVWSIIHVMGLYKAFGVLNYSSCINAIKLAFKYLSFFKALTILVSFIMISITPAVLVKKMWKLSLRFRGRTKEKVEAIWHETCVALGSWSCGSGEGRTAKDTGIFLKIKPDKK
jgi:glycosyltransferase involved in cell wall biosynthesis